MRQLELSLQELLSSLNPDDWNRQTVAKKWNVKDVAAHLLDTALRGLSVSRDKFYGEKPGEIKSYTDLVNFLNNLNTTWTDAAKRISPQLLTDLLHYTGKEYIDHLEKLNPDADAIYAVSWAGHDRSPNWFHIAREYTERFLHQQQIREAVGRPGLLTSEYYIPFLDILMQALPVTLKDFTVPNNTVIRIEVTDQINHSWFITFLNGEWNFTEPTQLQADTTVIIPADIAWKLFSKSIRKEDVKDQIKIIGNPEQGNKVLEMVAFMA